ncbi:MAG: hypothetical protein KME15_13620 [Drouetiella hepatica Uher 2000/2452]|uniref:Uncharacterized protein n=1 Tax=Drouetiella hepatica Uher 2000/2452 TaxID=904376 RepID=A0A951QC31_9CYAN|nr:hypothetical protein [Drouetiella hepatica Uher 2000/2452]
MRDTAQYKQRFLMEDAIAPNFIGFYAMPEQRSPFCITRQHPRYLEET